MGIEVCEELIDFEIRYIIKSLNELDFLQTTSSCSGWTDSEEDSHDSISDGINRKWRGQPYVYLLSLDDFEMIKFIKSIMFKLDYISPNNILNYNNLLSTVSMINNGHQLLHVSMEYRNDALLFIININEFKRSQEDIQKIWKLFNNLVLDYRRNYENKI